MSLRIFVTRFPAEPPALVHRPPRSVSAADTPAHICRQRRSTNPVLQALPHVHPTGFCESSRNPKISGLISNRYRRDEYPDLQAILLYSQLMLHSPARIPSARTATIENCGSSKELE